MNLSWRLFLGLLVVGVVLASSETEEDDSHIPDAGVEDEEEDEAPLEREESRNLRPRAYQPTAYSNTLPSGFRPSPSLAELAGYQRQSQQQQQSQEQQESYVNLVPSRPPQQQQYQEERQQQQRAPQRNQHVHRPTKVQQQGFDDEIEDEKEEPDRLSLLLQQSKFNCVSKQTGYYADEELNCEVFHYCQDSVKHSWICPDGFTFHQVHLICMPPNHDNICQKSSKYFFVNDYLYRPINEEEVQRKPNTALKYSDRYYPSEVYNDDRYEEDDDEDAPPRHSPPTSLQQLQQIQQVRTSPRPTPAQQVFRSAEEVNIPLIQRRPQQRPYEIDFN